MMRIITVISMILAIVGALNWFLVGAFSFDLVAWIFGGMTTPGARTIYIIIGIAAIWLTAYLIRVRAKVTAY